MASIRNRLAEKQRDMHMKQQKKVAAKEGVSSSVGAEGKKTSKKKTQGAEHNCGGAAPHESCEGINDAEAEGGKHGSKGGRGTSSQNEGADPPDVRAEPVAAKKVGLFGRLLGGLLGTSGSGQQSASTEAAGREPCDIPVIFEPSKIEDDGTSDAAPKKKKQQQKKTGEADGVSTNFSNAAAGSRAPADAKSKASGALDLFFTEEEAIMKAHSGAAVAEARKHVEKQEAAARKSVDEEAALAKKKNEEASEAAAEALAAAATTFGFRCDHCFQPHEQLKRCGGCRMLAYCSVPCQKKNWKTHKSVCILISGPEKEETVAGAVAVPNYNNLDCKAFEDGLKVLQRRGTKSNIKEILEGMTRCMKHSKAMEAALESLAFLIARNEEPIIAALGEAGSVECVIAAMLSHKAVWQLQYLACLVLCGLAVNEKNQAKIGVAGGIGCIIGAMSRNRNNSDLQMHACRALFNILANKHDENAMKIAAAGGIEAIVSAMRSNTGHMELQLEACRALYAPNRQIALKIASAGGIECMIVAMWTHHSNLELQSTACKSLSELVFQDSQGAPVFPPEQVWCQCVYTHEYASKCRKEERGKWRREKGNLRVFFFKKKSVAVLNW